MGGGGGGSLALLASFPSVISSLFTQNKGGGDPPGPSPRSATGHSIFVSVTCVNYNTAINHHYTMLHSRKYVKHTKNVLF